MAEYLPVKIYAGQPGTSAGVLYTCAQGEQIVVDNVIICNTTASAAVLTTLDVVPSGGTAGAAHRISGGLSIAANATVSLASSLYALGIVLEEGDFLEASQTTSAALTLTVTGRAVHN